MVTTKKKKKAEYETFHFEIDACVPSYGFAVEQTKWRSLSYWEYLDIRIDATCLSPEKARGRACRLVFLADRDIAAQKKDDRSADAPKPAVGGLTLRKSDFSYLGSLPRDAIWPLYEAIRDGTIKVLQLHGGKSSHGSATIHSVHFDRSVDPDDLK